MHIYFWVGWKLGQHKFNHFIQSRAFLWVVFKSSKNVTLGFPVWREIQLGSEPGRMQSYGLRGEQDWRSGASIPGELDQGDRVNVADQHRHRPPPVVHPEHPFGELWGRLHVWEDNQPRWEWLITLQVVDNWSHCRNLYTNCTFQEHEFRV